MKKVCCIPGCGLTVYSLGACRKHHAGVKALMGPQPTVSSKLPPLTTRVSAEARKKLEAAGEGTQYEGAYKVASRLLETIPQKEVTKYLSD